MSKVTITIEVDRYICTELEDVREMLATLDFSGLKASIERIQKHANSMESALRNYNNYLGEIRNIIRSTDYNTGLNTSTVELTPEEKLLAIEAILKKKYEDW